jgi:WD40 repeat protein
LLGVATPADLISDTRLSPFNIGRRIVVTDFTPGEAAPLAKGLGQNGEALLARVLFWTNGNPYLTQRLCRALAEEKATRAADVDRLCEALFLSKSARDTDDNLAFVRNRLLRSEADLASLLDLYTQVRQNKRVKDDETNPLTGILRLSGVARVEGGLLRVRNRIYDRVFDKEWVLAHMPDAELRRQRAAYRRGLLRAAVLSGVVLAVMGVLSLVAVGNARRAETETEKAQVAQRAADTNAQEARNAAVLLRQNLYAADMNVAQQALDEDNLIRARSLLGPYRPRAGEEDLRTFEWRYLWKMSRDQSRWTRGSPQKPAMSPAFSPDGKIVAVAQREDTKQDRIVLLDAATGQEVAALGPLKTLLGLLVFSPDGKTLAAPSADNTVVLFDVAARRQVGSLPPPKAGFPPTSVAFSPDSKVLVITGGDGLVKLWDVAARRVVSSYAGYFFVVFSPDGRRLVAITRTGVMLWDIASGRKRLLFPTPGLAPGSGVTCAAFSPDRRQLAVGFINGTIGMWETDTGRTLKAPQGHRWYVASLTFSPDGKRLASASTDTTIRLWETATGRELRTLRGHQGEVGSIAFSPDGRTLISGSGDSTVKLWDAAPESGEDRVEEVFATLSRDGRTLAAAWRRYPPGAGVTLRDTDTLRTTSIIPPRNKTQMIPLGFSGDGKTVYLWVGNEERPKEERPEETRIAFWDIAARRETGSMAASGLHFSICWLSPDGTLLVGGRWGGDGPLRIFDLAGRRELKHPLKGNFAAFSADGKWLGVSRGDGTFRVWDTQTWKPVSPPLRVAEAASDGPVAFSPDGRLLVTGSRTGRVDVWDTATWKRMLPTGFQAHFGFVLHIAFSPDGKTLTTRSDNRITKLWNTTTWRQTLSLPVVGGAWLAYFTPDEKTLVTTGDSTYIWRAASLAEADAPARSSAAPGTDPPPAARTPKQKATTTGIQKASR